MASNLGSHDRPTASPVFLIRPAIAVPSPYDPVVGGTLHPCFLNYSPTHPPTHTYSLSHLVNHSSIPTHSLIQTQSLTHCIKVCRPISPAATFLYAAFSLQIWLRHAFIMTRFTQFFSIRKHSFLLTHLRFFLTDTINM